MAGMEYDETHSLPDALLHPLDELVPHLAMRLVSPPQQHVGPLEALDGQPMLRLVEGRGLDRN
jgi:hypothetical protein